MTTRAIERAAEHSDPAPPQAPKHLRVLRWILAAGIVGGPLTFVTGGTLAPSVHVDGASTITANAAADPAVNATHLAAFFLASFLLPIGAIGLGWLAYPRAPRLAIYGGLLAVVGWLPFAALTALDDLGAILGRIPDGAQQADLLDRFTNGPVMLTFLIVYIVGHLVAYVLLGRALRGVIPSWASWSIVASSPLTVVMFAFPGNPQVIGFVALGLLVVGSVPAARAMIAKEEARA